jgi:hypothetical protein
MVVSITAGSLVNYCEYKNHLADDGTVLPQQLDCNSTSCEDSSSYINPNANAPDVPEDGKLRDVLRMNGC